MMRFLWWIRIKLFGVKLFPIRWPSIYKSGVILAHEMIGNQIGEWRIFLHRYEPCKGHASISFWFRNQHYYDTYFRTGTYEELKKNVEDILRHPWEMLFRFRMHPELAQLYPEVCELIQARLEENPAEGIHILKAAVAVSLDIELTEQIELMVEKYTSPQIARNARMARYLL